MFEIHLKPPAKKPVYKEAETAQQQGGWLILKTDGKVVGQYKMIEVQGWNETDPPSF
jgi:hypothetical protein